MYKKDGEAIPSMLTTDEAALFMRITREQIQRLCRSGAIKAVKPGRRYLIPRREIKKILSREAGQ